ncbi:MAG: hypothetical protein ACLR6W_09185, partial [Evtepia sp.]
MLSPDNTLIKKAATTIYSLRLFYFLIAPLYQKTKDLKSHDFRSFGGDKRDRTADLLNAIQ